NSPNWISIDKSELQILPGDSALVTITVDLTNVSIDYQTASIIIKDSVTNNLLKIVPVNAVLFTDVNERTEGAIPYQFTLSQNYPNPFNLGTVIRFQVPSTKFVTLKIYDLLGREVQTLVNEYISAGIYEANFDASSLASGLYLYKLTAGNFTLTKRMMLVK
ncbi:MAG: T9SS type A sorting domain-containing protein, partial [Bacteroidota bacterium]